MIKIFRQVHFNLLKIEGRRLQQIDMKIDCRWFYIGFQCCLYVFFLSFNSYSQTSLEKFDLDYGNYNVGFQHNIVYDSSRTYIRIYDYTKKSIPRPISISAWYPSTQNTKSLSSLTILDYFRIIKQEEEWEYLPDEQLLNWFYYANTPQNQNHLTESTKAFLNLERANGQFPIIIYTASYHASSIENFALCELLASHGYLVLSVPSKGSDSRWLSNNNPKEIETQARNIEFVINESLKWSIGDQSNIATMGFSFGGLASVLSQMRNQKISAVVSLDGTERYLYNDLAASPFFNLLKMEVPYIHMSQKIIPDKVLKEEKINPELNTKFTLYDSLTKSNAYKLKFNDLSHSYFSTLGVLFQPRDLRQDKTDQEIIKSYKLVSEYTLNFLNAFLKNDKEAQTFIDTTPLKNGIKEGLVNYSSKRAIPDLFEFADFNELAKTQEYNDLKALYTELLKSNPTLVLPEGNLNTLGLQLIFNPSTSNFGIKVLEFATSLYANSANLWDSLAEAYLFIGDKDKAITSFKKSLELNSENQNAISRLKQLSKR